MTTEQMLRRDLSVEEFARYREKKGLPPESPSETLEALEREIRLVEQELAQVDAQILQVQLAISKGRKAAVVVTRGDVTTLAS
jgi:hypothetical protein